jgi:hypothetical protein
MGKFTEEDINRILNLKGANGKLINVFDLHGVIFIGNTQTHHVVEGGIQKPKETWDLTKTYKRHSEHSIAMDINDFEFCETEEEVQDTFAEALQVAIESKLL